MDDPKPTPKLVKFGTAAVQRLRRVALPPLLIENMGLQEGEKVEILFDSVTNTAMLKKAESTATPPARPARKGANR